MKNLIIIGAGGFAREVAWLVEDINTRNSEWNLLGFIDENKDNFEKVLNGFPVLGGFEVLKNYEDIYVVCAVGNTKTKKKLIEKAHTFNVKFATLIHPNVRISKYNEISEGVIVCADSILTTNIKVGKHVIINIDCTVGHDVVIDDYCTILPSANISGNVHLNYGCDIGTNSTIIQGKSIGEWSILGAGAVVVSDLPANCTAVGMPAKPIKFHEEGK